MMRKGPLTPRVRRWLRKDMVWTCVWGGRGGGEGEGDTPGNRSVGRLQDVGPGMCAQANTTISVA